MNAFMTYVILGLSLSIPVGPINAAQIDRGARYGFKHAWLVGFGGMIADILYMLLIYFGVAHFLDTPFMKTFLWLFGAFVLIYTGIDTLRNLNKANISDTRSSVSSFGSFKSGFLLSIMNPLSILFWLGIYGSVLAQSLQEQGTTQILWNTLGIFTGIVLWDLIMSVVASSFHRYANVAVLRYISVFAGLSMIGFGFYFGYQAYLMLIH
ncbi:threonine/homoserine/homoserine lactone efflux protein [Paenibacillus shirakamiensis]|uniref:Threonine/homoserine/homoserine lactone efflux protein n=1 Tax=Paenibacillus shirakamiensis TaxID=1265935 RepID=A0ABS4JDU0_9BACL|nr:LysE family translocator [Paenibacillus shirakamiensis]MBP1999883.1 threonine/homoserine/homoserine lactone efflux protein [Paenibacillus shirakamiensis]